MTDHDPIVGIDLGTTNSLVALVENGRPQVLMDADGGALVPSVVTLHDGEVIVGRKARELVLEHPESTVYSVKRLMGRSAEDLTDSERRTLPFEVVSSDRGLAKIRIGNREFMPEEISAMVLRELKNRASRHLGRDVTKAVITVPAYFDDAQRQATRLAGRLAGLEVLRIVNEPTAAALAYGLDRTQAGQVAIYDLGGGTFDVSVLEIKDGIFRVRSTAGDTQLGGDDFDRKLMELLLSKAPAGFIPDPQLRQALKQAAEAAKIRLTDHPVVQFGVVDERSNLRLEASVSRSEFEAMISEEVERTLQRCRKALEDAELESDQLRAVVLVGGSTRVPLVRRRVEEFFGRKPYSGIDPDLVVALGAALQADILSGESRELLLLDVIPLSLGIETYGGAVAKIILRNSPIPAQATDTFTTYVDQQTAIDLHVLQGERELAKDCRSLARFKLRGLPPLPAGMMRVDVRFLVDENGVLNVSAKERHTGIETGIEIVPSYGLTDSEIARIVDESFEHARADFAAHQRIDLQNECRTMLQATEKLLSEEKHGLDDKALEAIAQASDLVRRTLPQEDVKALKAAYDRLVDATLPLAGSVMSQVAQTVVQGKTIEEVLRTKPPARPAHAAASRGTSARQLENPPVITVLREATKAGDQKECGDLGEGFRTSRLDSEAGANRLKLTWRDSEEIGIRLHEKFPDVDPLKVRFTDLHRWVSELEGFSDDAKGSSEGILEAIQMAWYEEYQG